MYSWADLIVLVGVHVVMGSQANLVLLVVLSVCDHVTSGHEMMYLMGDQLKNTIALYTTPITFSSN